MVLDKIMKLIQVRRELPYIQRPADYFELAAGTSSGGIIAIMLFRLRMTTEDAIAQFRDISQMMFLPTVHGCAIPAFTGPIVEACDMVFKNARFDSTNLETFTDSVVERFVCTTVINKADTALLRSYRNATVYTDADVNKAVNINQDDISIKLAVKATSAAPTYFPEVDWKGLVFWDGGLLNNNPVDRLWYARYDTVGPRESRPPISCVLSLGTGHTRPSLPSSWFQLVGDVNSMVALATNTKAKDKDFSRHMSNLNQRPGYENTKYIRFDPSLGIHSIDLADYTSMDFLIRLTAEFLRAPEQQLLLDMAVDAICPEQQRCFAKL
ncbi:hypothetical protein CPB97_004325 [Podila verticillata]|nr:hypothetical protein CPB97_004325 [Podila verticillata]